MSKQGKGLAGFGAVAATAGARVQPEREKQLEAKVEKIHSMENTEQIREEKQQDALSNSVGDILHSVTKKPKPVLKRQISAYIDEDVAKKLDKFGKEHGKGAKSELINNFLKSVLK
ncbi:hypothetical protein RRU94_02930 [Domibacillus sp. DTU_2020_1001157_1_SI_ALB_TIR_016]|uniref:hypothetical protein n=1 Tax=Domibacillus sp. DTU_2020_1001157_1_SI_ALB_TIR_016 TaxID=3077789 RepID=UPI0028EB0806|nr:hypothetical protein [Domibacillus sp. DTU_2020_1001157_1_SI_ALB_TIR_016]WNS78917.1 hypothetical protein RRU94_02930 [Domibacillus sp. DTU_2020_1001157_1_SI_ALB_TIR_016]